MFCWIASSSSIDAARQAVARRGQLLARVAARQHHLLLLDVLRPDLEAQRHAAQFPLRELPARRVGVAVVEHHAHAGRGERVADLLRVRQHGLLPVAARDRHDHHLVRGDPRRQHEPGLVAVRHDHAADEPRRHAPRRPVDVLERLVARLEADLERLREVLAEVVRRPGLQRPAVAHQRLDRVGPLGAGELLALRLAARPRRAWRARSRRTPCRAPGSCASPLRPPRRSRAPCGPPARGTPSSAGTAASPSPSGRRSPTG